MTQDAEDNTVALDQPLTSDLQPRLCDLPFEILIKIVGFTEPPDIFRLGRTCRTMQIVFRERSLWYTAIHAVWANNAIFSPSFGDIYQLPEAYLHRIALDPYRVMRCISQARENSPTSQPFIRPVSTFQLWLSHFSTRRCNTIFLVPGGRYLFTLHRSDLHLWDLGFLGVRMLQTNPILLVSTEVRSFSANPSKDPKILRLRVRKPWHEQGWRHYEMHNIDFSVDPPSVSKLSSITIKSQGHQTYDSIDGDRAYVLTRSIMTVWDFVRNEFISWDTRTNPQQFFVEDNAVGVVDGRLVLVWKVPALLPNASETLVNGSSLPAFIEPEVILDLPSPKDYYTMCRGPNDWYTGQQQPIWFDLVEGPKTSFVRLKLERRVPDDISTYKLVPYPRSALAKDHTPFGYTMRPCLDSAVLWWVSKGRSIKCHIGPIFFDAPIDHDKYVVLCKVSNPTTKRQFSLCPVSGKFCYVDYEKNCIVVSYLLPWQTTSSW